MPPHAGTFPRFLPQLYEQAKAQQNCPMDQITNVVTKIYDSFTPEEVPSRPKSRPAFLPINCRWTCVFPHP